MADTQYSNRREFTRKYSKTPGAAGLFPITIEKRATFTYGGQISSTTTWAKDFQRALLKDTDSETKKLMATVVDSLMEDSPEDTGLMKHSWFVSSGKIARGIATPSATAVSKSSIDKFRYSAKAGGPQVNRLAYKKHLARLKLGKGSRKRLHIVNNVYYTSEYDSKYPFVASAIDEGVSKYIGAFPSDISDNGNNDDWLY